MRGKLSLHGPLDKVLTQALYKWGRMPLWVWLLPTAIPLLAFTYFPALRIAVEGFPALSKLFNGENLNSLKITLLYTLLTVPLSVLLGLLAALALEGDNRFRQFVRALVFHPVVLPTVAFAAVFLYLLNPLGPLQALLQALGLQNPLGDPRGAFLAVVVVGVLKDIGIYMLYYLAGLQNLPKELLDAARVDGAGRLTTFLYVTWPLLSPTTFFVTVMAALGALRNVDHIFILTKGGPVGATDHLLYRIYTLGFEYFRRVLLDLDPRDVKKEGVPCGKIVSTPSTILTQRPSSWLSTSGWTMSSRPFRPKGSSSPESKGTRKPPWLNSWPWPSFSCCRARTWPRATWPPRPP
jgi:ABC-type sugar transport systems, permease components